jgi:putative MATE family efflux protein
MAGPGRDLTEGPIASTLLLFAIPTLVGNILQSLNASINMVWIGRFLGETSLAATANATNIIFLAFSAFFGFGMAATVLVGQHIGRKDIDGARRAVGAAAGLFLLITAIIVAFGVGLTDKLLHLMGTPHEAQPLASAYLKMMLLTLPASSLVVLMMMSLRGSGDAMTPLWFMIIGILFDAGLNPFLIAGIGPFPKLGIVGSALATMIANIVSLVGMLIVVYWRDLPIRLRGAELRYLLPQPALLKLILSKGFLMGMQMLVMTASGLVMIGLVNHAGVMAAAAYGVAFQLWNYIQMPAMAIGAAVSAMAAQNIGAGRWDRVRAITNGGLLYNLLLTGAALFAFWLFDQPVLGLFMGPKSAAIPIAVHIQVLAGWSFLFSGMTLVLFGTARANGAVLGPLLCMAAAILGGRLAFAIFAQPWLGFDALWWAFPFGSVLNCLLAWAYYVNGSWKKGVLVDEAVRAEHPERTETVSA